MSTDPKADLYHFAKAQRESNARLELWNSAAEAVGYLDAIAVLERLEELEAENQRLRDGIAEAVSIRKRALWETCPDCDRQGCGEQTGCLSTNRHCRILRALEAENQRPRK